MATLTMTPTRQPLGCIDTMRPLMSKLNRQSNAGPKSMKPNTIFVDSENIDPSKISSKRKRSGDDEEPTASKPKTSRIALSTVSPRLSTPLRTTQSLSTPKSAPILNPAGRSPPPKSSKLGRRSAISKPRSASSGKRAVARPFSLASALQASSSPKPAPKAPNSWFFDIHVDSEQDEMTNLMQHSTTVLDISDDEGKAVHNDSRGKENIPPAELGNELPSAPVTTTAVAASARKESKMEEDRAPLGELDAADFYAEGCTACSYVVVHEEPVEFKKPSSPLAQSQEALSTSIASVLEAVTAKAEAESQSADSSVSDENTAPSS
ncbi:uncharacterized protein N7511_000130 [Penicillium nucicola]|uniref:uncharacterized protein n=1 Tax=Penicillium nucicola TaxID=1850975 RepID=UPI00254525FF|nr:uncharacterized protein N7511_000130 [Penicillium nucicola]KAJ5775119.1 hypothetical protein N7511_000130 [Penicillium nucicola]